MLSTWLYGLGGAIFAALGLLHGAFTLADLRRPRRLVPSNPALKAAMQASGVRLAGTGTTMWRAWIGFNLSHSLGAVVFGLGVVAAGLPGQGASAVVAWLPSVIGAAYLGIGLGCWFKVPNAGIAIACACFMAGALLR
jgi:hypothetical protein